MLRLQKRKKAVKSGNLNKMRAPRLLYVVLTSITILKKQKTPYANLDGERELRSTQYKQRVRTTFIATIALRHCVTLIRKVVQTDVESNGNSNDMQNDKILTPNSIGASMSRSDLSLDWAKKHAACDCHFLKMVSHFGIGCDVCNRHQFKKDLLFVKAKHCKILRSEFPDQVVEAMAQHV